MVDYPAKQFRVNRSGSGYIKLYAEYPEAVTPPRPFPSTIVEYVDGVPDSVDWDTIGYEEAQSENINYRSSQVRVVADNGFEWVVELVDQV